MNTTPQSSTSRQDVPTLVGRLATHAVLLATLWIYLVFFVPGQARVFRDFMIKLPPATEWVVAVSAWAVEYVLLVPPLSLAVLGIDVAVLFLLGSGASDRRSRAWFWGVTIALAAILVSSMVAIQLPAAQLREGLSR